MKHCAQILVRIYARMLGLYPRRYRADYGEELQTVFSLVVNEAAQRGRFSVIRLGWRELRDLPGAVIREHWRERKKEMETETSVPTTFEPAPWREGLAAIALFLLGALGCLLSWLHLVLPPWLAIGFLLYPLFMFALGLIKGLRRWFLPYAGLVGCQLGWALTTRGTIMGIDTRAGWIGSLLSWTDRLLVRPGDPLDCPGSLRRREVLAWPFGAGSLCRPDHRRVAVLAPALCAHAGRLDAALLRPVWRHADGGIPYLRGLPQRQVALHDRDVADPGYRRVGLLAQRPSPATRSGTVRRYGAVYGCGGGRQGDHICRPALAWAVPHVHLADRGAICGVPLGVVGSGGPGAGPAGTFASPG